MSLDIRRMNYYNQLFLRETEFKLEQNYHIRKRALQNRYFFSPGIVSGFEVEPLGQQPTPEVRITAGMILNRVTVRNDDYEETISQEIILPKDGKINLKQYSNKDVYIYTYYDEELGGENEDGQKEIHIIEQAKLAYSTSLPQDNGTVNFVLAKVSIGNDGNVTAINYNENNKSLRIYAGINIKNITTPNISTHRLQVLNDDNSSVIIESKKVNNNSELSVAASLNVTGKMTVSKALEVDGTIKANTFVGDGSQLTGIRTDCKWVEDKEGISFSKGNVGIGTNEYGAKLTINSSFKDWKPDYPAIMMANKGGATGILQGSDANNHVKLEWTGKEMGIVKSYGRLCTTGQPLVIQENGGMVGIGTTKPAATLDIKGSLRINEGTTFQKVQAGIFVVATSNKPSRLSKFYFPQPVFKRVPQIVFSVGEIGTDDTFVVNCCSISTDAVVLKITNLNQKGWDKELKIHWIAWECEQPIETREEIGIGSFSFDHKGVGGNLL